MGVPQSDKIPTVCSARGPARRATVKVVNVADVEDLIGDPPFDSLVDKPDLNALDAWLEAADDAQLRRAAAWHRKHKAALRELQSGEQWENNRARVWAATLLVASTAAPGEAVTGLRWNEWWFVRGDERELLSRALLRRSREWAAAFVPRAARVKLGRRLEPSTAPFLFEMLDMLVRHHDLPVPEGDAFLNGWARVGSRADWYLPVLLGPLLRSSHLRHRPDLPAVIEASIAAGEITRASVVAAALEALATIVQPSAQRVLADVLTTSALTPDELAGRLPLLKSSLATAHGSITAVLLPLAVSLGGDAADLDEIAAIVASRPEKRQRDTLLYLLQDRDLRMRLGDDAVRGALDHLYECDDAALRERVVRFRRTLVTREDTADAADAVDIDASGEADVGSTSAHDDMWTPINRERASAADPLQVPIRLNHADIRRFLGEMSSVEYRASLGRVNRTGHAMVLECVVRGAAPDPAALRAWLPTHDHETWRGLLPVPGAIICWLRGDLDDGPIYDDRIPGNFLGDTVVRWRPRQRLINAAAREALWRAGRVSTVLSTPSHTDGTLELGVLLRRIENGHVPSYTPCDLAQALLRLRLVSSEDQARMDGTGDLALPADPTCWAEHASNQGRPDAAPHDGVELIRRWVDEGGVRSLDARWQMTEGIRGPYSGLWWGWGDEPPLPVGVLQSLLVDAADVIESTSTTTAVTLAPCWTDLAATSLFGRNAHADILLDGPGPMGTPSHGVVLAPLSGPPELQRRAVHGLLELVRRDALSVPHLCQAVEVLNKAGVLPLRRVARGLEQAFVGGGLADLWTVALGITAAASARRPLPQGLPDLLRLLADYLPAVPDRDLPVELMELAAARGTSKSHAEARALMSVQKAL